LLMQVLNLTRLPRASKISYFSDRLLGLTRYLLRYGTVTLPRLAVVILRETVSRFPTQ
jgi:hypothetical protein